ncbi:MAG: hypothetical protein L0Z50_37365 [Verrucomicrobiales bacterium]|nr:hypothetical protein [Verrucomicrobiales bacterium]
MDFLIADTFTDSLARLTGDEQKAVKTTAFDLQMNPASPGLSFHKLDKARDKNFWSVRASADIRLVVHKTQGSLLLCYVDHHDKAYDWAERRKLEIHPKTGAAQLVEIRETVKEVVVPVYVRTEIPAPPKPSLFADKSDEELLGYGVPAEWFWMCQGQRFIYRMSASGSQWVMETCPARDGELPRWVELPAPEFLEMELFDLLPALTDLSGRASLSLKGKPSLADHKPKRLSDDELAELLGSVPMSAFYDPKQLAYILRLIPDDAYQSSPDSPFTRSLVKLANQLLGDRLPAAQELRTSWKEFFLRLPAAAIVRLPCISGDVAPEVAVSLMEPSFPIALLWQDFREAEGKGSIPWPSLLPVLQRLGELALAGEIGIKQRSGITVCLLRACASLQQNWTDLIGRLPLFHARQPGEPSRAASIADLRGAHRDERLFTVGHSSWAADLVKATPEANPLLVEKAIADLLIIAASDCGKASCVKLVRKASRLAGDFASRKGLFDLLLHSANLSQHRRLGCAALSAAWAGVAMGGEVVTLPRRQRQNSICHSGAKNIGYRLPGLAADSRIRRVPTGT